MPGRGEVDMLWMSGGNEMLVSSCGDVVCCVREAPSPAQASPRAFLYVVGVVSLFVSEVAYGAWMAASLATWWRSSAQAQLARRAADLVHDLKPALLAMERYRDLAHPLYDMIEEMEQQAPNNVYVIVVFALIGFVLQIAAVVMARRLARRDPQLAEDEEGEKCAAEGGAGAAGEKALCAGGGKHDACCDELSEPEPPPGGGGGGGVASVGAEDDKVELQERWQAVAAQLAARAPPALPAPSAPPRHLVHLEP
ncbi:unnamed protein product [Plutella xylostella]|uniref:(diamondback moth) hypothetical protein n=1 Tax=Plutella xylostella TaxID=51655 RepID=A0A8S4G9K1_PLUXY|nr:unnamed protein product [Plutella xylostella]